MLDLPPAGLEGQGIGHAQVESLMDQISGGQEVAFPHLVACQQLGGFRSLVGRKRYGIQQIQGLGDVTLLQQLPDDSRGRKIINATHLMYLLSRPIFVNQAENFYMHDIERFTKSAKNSWFLPPKKAGFGSQKGAKNEKIAYLQNTGCNYPLNRALDLRPSSAHGSVVSLLV